ncbi:unnamed protein product, partial [Urochloa humidicola]
RGTGSTLVPNPSRLLWFPPRGSSRGKRESRSRPMALRNLASGTLGPAACALRCRSGAGMPAAAPSRFLATIRNQVKQHSNGTRKETSDEKAILMKELDE